MPDFEQGSYTDSNKLPKSTNLYFIKEGFIFKDEDLAYALSSAWNHITDKGTLPPAHEAKSMKRAFSVYLMERKDRRGFAAFGTRHKQRTKLEYSTLVDYAKKFIRNNWGTQTNPFGQET